MKKQSLFITSLVIIGGLILMSMSIIKTNQEKPWEAPSKYVKMENPYAKASDEDNVGRTLYSKHCKSCHGSKGLGDGTKASSIDTKVPDFTNGTFKKETDGSIYYKTFFGRDDMPSFEKKVTDEEERWLIVNYVKTLAN